MNETKTKVQQMREAIAAQDATINALRKEILRSKQLINQLRLHSVDFDEASNVVRSSARVAVHKSKTDVEVLSAQIERDTLTIGKLFKQNTQLRAENIRWKKQAKL